LFGRGEGSRILQVPDFKLKVGEKSPGRSRGVEEKYDNTTNGRYSRVFSVHKTSYKREFQMRLSGEFN